MALLTKQVITTWNSRTAIYYMSLGYKKLVYGEKFLVKVNHLPKGSDVKVQVSCNNCNKIRMLSYKRFLEFKTCNNCKHQTKEFKQKISIANQRNYKLKGHGHRFGAKFTDSQREHLRQIHLGKRQSEKTKQKLRKIALDNKLGQNNKGRKTSQETKNKIRSAMIQGYKNGRKPSYGKGQYYKTQSGKNIWLRSSYEVAVAKYLDHHSLHWEYEPKAFLLLIDGQETTYRPDFFIESWNLWVEVKGWWRSEKSKKKVEVFSKLYPNFQCWDTEVLRSLEILK